MVTKIRKNNSESKRKKEAKMMSAYLTNMGNKKGFRKTRNDSLASMIESQMEMEEFKKQQQEMAIELDNFLYSTVEARNEELKKIIESAMAVAEKEEDIDNKYKAGEITDEEFVRAKAHIMIRNAEIPSIKRAIDLQGMILALFKMDEDAIKEVITYDNLDEEKVMADALAAYVKSSNTTTDISTLNPLAMQAGIQENKILSLILTFTDKETKIDEKGISLTQDVIRAIIKRSSEIGLDESDVNEMIDISKQVKLSVLNYILKKANTLELIDSLAEVSIADVVDKFASVKEMTPEIMTMINTIAGRVVRQNDYLTLSFTISLGIYMYTQHNISRSISLLGRVIAMNPEYLETFRRTIKLDTVLEELASNNVETEDQKDGE